MLIFSTKLIPAFSDVSDSLRPPVPGFIFPNPAIRLCFVQPKVFQNGESAEGSSKLNTSYVNDFCHEVAKILREAAIIPLILRSIFDHAGLEAKDIGILSPYKAQRRYINNLLINKFVRIAVV